MARRATRTSSVARPSTCTSHAGRHARGIAADFGDLPAHPPRLGRDRAASTPTTATTTVAGGVSRARAGRVGRGPVRPGGEDRRAAGAGGRAADAEDELVAEQAKLVTEREILRRAAKYFAGETNW